MPLSNLKRHTSRRYLYALLCSEEVPQSSECDIGPLWRNCNGEPAEVLDHDSHQLVEDAEASVQLGADDAVVSFKINRVTRSMLAVRADKTSIEFQIDIAAFGHSGAARADICDAIEERIMYRLLHRANFTDLITGEPYVAFLRQIDENGYQIEVRDDQSFDGNYTIREMSFTVTMTECLNPPGCEDIALCFDFKDLTRLDKDA